MNYEPKSEETLAKEGLLPEGVFDFEVIGTDNKPSKKGNEMITLKLCIFDRDGSQQHLFDYIALGTHFGERKLRHAAAACGLIGTYESGQLTDADFLNTTGKLHLKQQNGTSEYPLPRNTVSDYLPSDTIEPAKPVKQTSEIIDDNVPF